MLSGVLGSVYAERYAQLRAQGMIYSNEICPGRKTIGDQKKAAASSLWISDSFISTAFLAST